MKKAIKWLLIGTLFLCVWVFGVFVGENFFSEKTQIVNQIVQTQQPAALNQDELWSKIQEWRRNNGYSEYKLDSKLCDYAALRLEQIKTDWSHKGFREMSKAIYDYTNASQLGENLSKQFTMPVDSLNAWLSSKTHRENLEKPFTHSCIRTSGTYAVQLFALYK